MRIPSILAGDEFVGTTVDSIIYEQVMIMGTSKEDFSMSGAIQAVSLTENPVFSKSPDDKLKITLS